MPIESLIKRIQNIMRMDAGVDGDAQRLSQIVWILFLKIFDLQETEWKKNNNKYKSPLQKRFRWSSWVRNEDLYPGDELISFVNMQLLPEFKRLRNSNETNEQGRLIGAFFEDTHNYMKSGKLLKEIVDLVDSEIDFQNNKDKQLFGKIYETLLSSLQAAGNSGEFYTPRSVTRFMVDIVKPKIGEKVLDPACGTGGFLTDCIDYVSENFQADSEVLANMIYGFEKKQLPHMLAVTNLMLHGIELPNNIRHINSLATKLNDNHFDVKVNCILSNPPFGGSEEDSIINNFSDEYKTKETADLFLVLIMNLLQKKTGRAAIILPDSFLFGSGVKNTIKKELLDNFNLHTIVRLPNGVFSPYTNIKTNIIFFDNYGSTNDVWFFEHPLPKGQNNYSRQKPIKLSEFELEKKWWNSRVENNFAWKMTKEELVKRDYNLDINNPKIYESSNKSLKELVNEYEAIKKDYSEVVQKIHNILLEHIEVSTNDDN